MNNCLNSVEELRNVINGVHDIAFVPTMGNLHKGHLTLVEKAQSLSKNVVVSIFINPEQFNSKQDFNRYPKTLANDKFLLKKTCPKCWVYTPNDSILSYKSPPSYLLPNLSNDLCGKYRPGHFEGVIKIIDILFSLINPRYAIFGKKDYQQLILIKDFSTKNYPKINIIEEQTIRESNALALSSRNNLLNIKDKKKANQLYLALNELIKMIKLDTNHQNSIKKITDTLTKSGWDVEYISIRRQKDLQLPLSSTKHLVALAAAKLNGIRLIDNIEFCID